MVAMLEIHLLGPFRVAVGGSQVEARRWRRRSATLLLKLLALQPHHQLHREQVTEMLWPELEPQAAINNLHKTIHAARRALEPDLKAGAESRFIVTHAQQIKLCAPGRLWIDVEVFQQQAAQAFNATDAQAYEDALALYEGDLLIEDLYEDWAAARREQLRAQHQDLLADLARLYETQGRYGQSIERLQELLACEAANEEAHRRLMKLYAQTGSRHQALQQYRQCREALRRELDAEPDQATVTLYEQIAAEQITPLPVSRAASAGGGRAIDSLAILPLANATADARAEYLSDGITESIINSLSQLRQLRVMARSTVFRYKDRDVAPQQVGGELGVGAVMSGRVLQLADTLVIRVELVDTSDGSQLWGGQYNRRLADIFAVQEEIAREVSETLRLRLSGEDQRRLARHYTDSPEAYELYLKGRYFWNKRTEEGLHKAVAYFKQAIDADPDYALAYVGLADAYAFLGDIGVTAMLPDEAFAKAGTVVAKALAIDQQLAEAHTSLAHLHMHSFEWASAEREFRLALDLRPNYATAHHWHAYYLLITGRQAEAMEEIAKALALDPLSLPINTDVAELLYFSRQYNQAITESQKALEMDPQYFRAYLTVGRAYLQKGMYEEAVTAFRKARSLDEDNPGILAALGHAYAAAGNRAGALSTLDALRRLSDERYVSPYDMAVIHCGLGDGEQAMEWLHRAYEERAQWIIFLAVDPRFDSLGPDPSFRALITRLGLKLTDGAAATHRAIDSLAILPLVNDSGDASLEYLSDGITESIINNLSQLSRLKVMAWSTVLRYKNTALAPRAIGRELDVRALLMGRVLQLSDRLVIKTELVNIADGSQLWGGQYSRRLTDIFDLQEAIASEISAKLRLKLSGNEKRRLGKRHTEDTEAYQLYLKGRHCWYKRTEEGLRKSIEFFNRAIDRDPAYALAYDGLSDAYALLALRGIIPAQEAFPKSKAAAKKALEIDDSLGEAYASLSHVRLHDWDWSGLDADFKRALELSAGHAMALHWYAEYLRAMGRADEAIAIEKQAEETDPLSPITGTALGTTFHFARQYDQAINHLRKALEINPDHFLLHFRLGLSYLQKEMHEAGIAEMQRAVSLSGGSTETLAGLAQAYAASGEREAMQEVLGELIAHSGERYISPYQIAKVYAAAGELEPAFAWLEKAYTERHPDLIELNVEPVVDGLRRDPRFDDLLRRMRLLQAEPTAPAPVRPMTPRSIAVLPFKPISVGGRDEYLEMGLADALITRLSRVSRLVVRSIHSVRKFAELEQDVLAAGQALQVEAVLEGSLQRLGERIRISARLVRVEDGCSLWADKFDERFTDIFEIEDSISEKVAAALALQLTGAEIEQLTRRYTENAEAYELYLQGRYFWNKRIKGGFKKAIDYFNQAVALDPTYALAYTGLADCYAMLSWYSLLSPRQSFPKAKAAALQALAIDDRLAEAHNSLAAVKQCYEWNWPEAEREFLRALELKPGYATAHQWYAILYLTAVGRHEEAIREMRQAQALDPLSLVINRDVGWALYYARRYTDAIQAYRKTFALDPHFVQTHFFLSLAYEQADAYREAIAEFHAGERRQPKGSARAWTLLARARMLVVTGKLAEAAKIVEELTALSARHYVSPFLLATIYAGLAAEESAFAWLEKAYHSHDPYLTFLNVEPALDRLRPDPRFADLLRRVGLAD